MLHRIHSFIKTESAAGIVMLAFAALALIAANSPFTAAYHQFVATELTVGHMSESLGGWVKDVLMVFFFLVVGMELKREMQGGFLAKREQILLPLGAALGGMVAPAFIFFSLNHHIPANMAGWAIPSATDIAFALCILMLVSKNIPPAAKIFLLAIAIFDDLGAILIIATFYSDHLALEPLALVAAGLAVLAALNWRNITAIPLYLLVGVFLWLWLHAAGIHTTIAGVAVGMAIPVRDRKGGWPLKNFLHHMHPWVSFGVLPIFAFTAAGVSFDGFRFSDLLEPLPLGIALGLFFGKQIGIFGITWVLVKTGIARRPEGTSWIQLYGIAVIAGIGFTMSLFIGLLAFSDVHLQEMVKIGVISGSLLSTVWAAMVLRVASLKPREE